MCKNSLVECLSYSLTAVQTFTAEVKSINLSNKTQTNEGMSRKLWKNDDKTNFKKVKINQNNNSQWDNYSKIEEKKGNF